MLKLNELITEEYNVYYVELTANKQYIFCYY